MNWNDAVWLGVIGGLETVHDLNDWQKEQFAHNLWIFEVEEIEAKFDKSLDRLLVAEKIDKWGDKYSRYPLINDDSIWKVQERIIEEFEGKSFNDAFSKFCSIVPKQHQKDFFYHFTNRRGRDSEYITDDEGMIRKNPTANRYVAPKKQHVVRSWDFKSEWKSSQIFKNGRFIEFVSQEEIISGQKFEFDSRDYKFKRCFEDNRKKKKMANKKAKKEKEKSKDHLLKTLVNKRAKQEKALNDIKMLSKGFDPITSFRHVG